MKKELSFQVLRALEKSPKQSQRELSNKFHVSLGSIHYCLNALIEKGYIKVQNFKNSKNKLAYAYNLTPSGIKLKKALTVAFLECKQAEYQALKKEINALERDIEQ